MADHNPHKTKFLNIAHLPTWMLIVGYPVYWLELYVLKADRGITSFLAWAVLAIVAVILFYPDRMEIKVFLRECRTWFQKLPFIDRGLIGPGFLLCAVILGVALYAWFLPLHLIQESDSMIYRAMLPRQHLIRGSFEFISWSTFDLYLLPLDYAIAPFSLSTVFPNKIPQLIFFIGLLLIAVESVNRRPLPALLVIFLILGSHGIGIQMGTAMTDLAVAYLLLAAWDSLRHGKTALFLAEFCFYFWAKSFIPLQSIGIAMGLWIIYRIFKLTGNVSVEVFPGEEIKLSVSKYKQTFIKAIIGFLILSSFVAGPFMAKSLWHAGTPLYPIAPGSVMLNKDIDRSSPSWKSIEETARAIRAYVKTYGGGKDAGAFIKHLWLIAVPEKDVNNRFDYPIGLPFLLMVLPFFWLFFKTISRRIFTVSVWFAVLYWGIWWMTSQQTRFLYITLLLMFVLVIFDMKIFPRPLIFCILIALVLNALSVARAHKMDFGRSAEEVLRPKDLALVRMSQEYLSSGKTGSVELDYGLGDVAFAQFPAVISKESFPNVLYVNGAKGKK